MRNTVWRELCKLVHWTQACCKYSVNTHTHIYTCAEIKHDIQPNNSSYPSFSCGGGWPSPIYSHGQVRIHNYPMHWCGEHLSPHRHEKNSSTPHGQTLSFMHDNAHVHTFCYSNIYAGIKLILQLYVWICYKCYITKVAGRLLLRKRWRYPYVDMIGECESDQDCFNYLDKFFWHSHQSLTEWAS